MKTLMIIVNAMMSFLLVASPVRGNLAASTHLSRTDKPKEITVRSYVQDGLVAMWDGIENSDFGIHDDSSIIWKDLIGDIDLTVASGGAWGEDFLQCLGTTAAAYGSVNAGAIQQMTVQYLISDVVTPTDDFRNLICMPGSAGMSTPCSSLQISTTGEMAITHNLRFPAPTEDEMCLVTVEGNNATTSYYGSPPKVYLNNFVPVVTSSTIGINNNGSYICVGSRWNSNGRFAYAAQGKVHCIRIYNRYLSQKEIIHNYKVDKVRFGL